MDIEGQYKFKECLRTLKEIGNENLGQWSNNVQQGNINMVELLFNKVLSELDKKDKIINAMAIELSALDTGLSVVREQFRKEYCEFINSDEDCCWKTNKDCKDCIIDYFTKKVEE